MNRLVHTLLQQLLSALIISLHAKTPKKSQGGLQTALGGLELTKDLCVSCRPSETTLRFFWIYYFMKKIYVINIQEIFLSLYIDIRYNVQQITHHIKYNIYFKENRITRYILFQLKKKTDLKKKLTKGKLVRELLNFK